jgi:3-isopropylmalate dehydrogenase
VASHSFSYTEADVRRFVRAAARLAEARSGRLAVVIKEAGVPAVSDLWREVALEETAECDVACAIVDVDLMAYRLLAAPRELDVVAAPNMCGDVLSDIAALLVGTRAFSFGASYSPEGFGVYQTNHGAAHDIAGAGVANPCGQMLSLAMLLRTSLGLDREACAIEQGIRRVWADGHRTREAGGTVGTAEMASLVAVAAADELAGALAA